MKNPKFLRGFSLVEIMIVIALITLLAAIAVPNFVRAHKRAINMRIIEEFVQKKLGPENLVNLSYDSIDAEKNAAGDLAYTLTFNWKGEPNDAPPHEMKVLGYKVVSMDGKPVSDEKKK